MSKTVSLPIGARRGVAFGVTEIDVVRAEDDLLVIGMPEKDVVRARRGGADAIDDVLHGTLSRLREGGIFSGGFGETLMLTQPPPPIRAAALLLIGMGTSPAARPEAIGTLAGMAMQTALRIGAGSVGCLLGWSGLDVPLAAVVPTAAAMMRGVLTAVDSQGGDVAAMRWTFDIRNGAGAETTAALREALAAWT